MLTGSTAALFDEACFNLPTLGELHRLATLDAFSRVRYGYSLFEVSGSRDARLAHSHRSPNVADGAGVGGNSHGQVSHQPHVTAA